MIIAPSDGWFRHDAPPHDAKEWMHDREPIQTAKHMKRLIKKYPNRRLYDTEESRYITLPDVERLVLESVSFWVQDTKTKSDITRSILLQVIAEREASGPPLFSQVVLEQLVRIYAAGMQEMGQSFLERTLGMWADTQEQFRENVTSPLPADPASAMQELADRNMRLWSDMQERFMQAYNSPAPPRDRSDD
ncbi:MAG: polyhydroxyalkanoate synthesis repressor PhaR [Pseudomonadota bacterium]